VSTYHLLFHVNDPLHSVWMASNFLANLAVPALQASAVLRPRLSAAIACALFVGTYLASCCRRCGHRVLVFVDSHLHLQPAGILYEEPGEHDMGASGQLVLRESARSESTNPGVELLYIAPLHHTRVLPVAMLVAIPVSSEEFLLALPLLLQYNNVSEIVKGMQQHLSHRRVQEHTCPALLQYAPTAAGEDYDAICSQAGGKWQSMQAQYSRLAELGVIQAALRAMSAHPDSSVMAEAG